MTKRRRYPHCRFAPPKRQLRFQSLENRRVLATLGVDIEFLDSGGTEITESVLRGEDVTVEVKVQDIRSEDEETEDEETEDEGTPVGVIALPLNLSWNNSELQLDPEFEIVNPLPPPNPLPTEPFLVTGQFPVQRSAGTLIIDAAGDAMLPNVQGASLPNLDQGQAIGVTGADPFSRISFTAVASAAETSFTVELAGAMSFADAAVLDGVMAIPPTINVAGTPNTVQASIAIVGGSISGIKFNDLNGNGDRDVGEPGLDNVTIRIQPDAVAIGNNAQADSVLTNADGSYAFTDLPKGSYTITEDVPDGFRMTVLPNDGNPIELDQTRPNVTGADVGNEQITSVSGVKFDDLNGNGTRDAGEPGKPGITIMLDRVTDAEPERTATTDADGMFLFENVPAGIYSVSEMLPALTVQTTPGEPSAPLPFTVDVAPPEAITGLLFGNFELTTLRGTTFEDLDADGVQDAGELPLDGVTVNLDLMNDGSIDLSMLSDAEGQFQFNDVGPGTHRVIQEPIVSFNPTLPNPPERLVDNLSGTDIADLNFGNQRVPVPDLDGSISGSVYSDTDFDGVFDEGEFGLPGVMIQLVDGDRVITQTTTSATGSYRFDNLDAGTYRLVEIQPEGFGDASITAGVVLPGGRSIGSPDGLNAFNGIIVGQNETAIDYHFGEVLTAVTKRMMLSSTNARGELASNIDPAEFRINGTAGDDRITITSLANDGVQVTVNDRQAVTLTPQQASLILIDGFGGNDRVDYIGSELNELVDASPSQLAITLPGQAIGVFSVEDIRVDGAGGDDFAVIRDSDGADELNARDNIVALLIEDGRRIGLTNFETVQAVSPIDSGMDQTNIEAIDFALQLAGDWQTA